MRQVRVLVVDDSMVFQKLLVDSLNSDPAITVVATASNAFEARDMIIKHKPDVMTLDVELPRMSGIEFLKKLMPQYPMPVVVISSLSDHVFDAMDAGAVEFVAKPNVADKKQLEAFLKNDLPVKIKIASTAHISKIKKNISPSNVEKHAVQKEDLIVAIGASTGGTEAIASVIKQFEPDIPGTLIVQHMPQGFTGMYAKRLDDQCRVHVKEAEDGDIVQKGHVLLAPGGDRHMRLVKSGGRYKVEIKAGPKVNGHCPSVDVLFDSVAEVAKDKAVGIILTGMGGDGGKGMLKMRQAGAKTIGQDESTCVVYGMPKVAYDLGGVMYQERLEDIPKRTYAILNKM